MANHSRDELENTKILLNTLIGAGCTMLGGMAIFTVNTLFKVAANQRLNNEIDILEDVKKELERGLGRLKNKKEINEIVSEIEEKRSQIK